MSILFALLKLMALVRGDGDPRARGAGKPWNKKNSKRQLKSRKKR